jgi:hypothetical protein
MALYVHVDKEPYVDLRGLFTKRFGLLWFGLLWFGLAAEAWLQMRGASFGQDAARMLGAMRSGAKFRPGCLMLEVRRQFRP